MRVGSLFSGIGGLEYGLERSGLSTSSEWMIEMNDFCCSILEKNFPNALVINDKVENIDPLDLPKIDILTAGFPCQPVSTAGSRKGVMSIPKDSSISSSIAFISFKDLRPKLRYLSISLSDFVTSSLSD